MAATEDPDTTPETIREEVEADLAELEDEARAEERTRLEDADDADGAP